MRTLTRGRLVLLAAALLASHVVIAQDAPRLQAVVGGATLPAARVASIVVDAGTSDVDAATVTVDLGRAKPPSIGEALEVLGGASLFKGEIVGIEPLFQGGGDSPVVIRALNRLHRLTRGRKSKTYEKQTDAEIVSRIASEAGLVAGPAFREIKITHDFIFQNNQTDLEFLRERAARIGFEVLVDDTTLLFRPQRDPEPTPLGCDGQAPLKRFHARLSSVNQVTAVTVRGWDPKQKKEIIGKAERRMIALSPGAEKIADPPGEQIDLGMVQGIDSAPTAYGAAKGTLNAMTAEDLSAEAEAEGNAALQVGALVSISGLESRFNGKYHVVGVSHRYQKEGAEWRTLLRFARADRGFYALPEVGDEVLVAFEHGDIAYPFIVGSLWNEKDKPIDHGRDSSCTPSGKKPFRPFGPK